MATPQRAQAPARAHHDDRATAIATAPTKRLCLGVGAFGFNWNHPAALFLGLRFPVTQAHVRHVRESSHQSGDYRASAVNQDFLVLGFDSQSAPPKKARCFHRGVFCVSSQKPWRL